MSIVLASVGCNYRGETCELPDCELDASIVAGLFPKLLTFGREVIARNATRRGFLKVYEALKAKKRESDLAVISFSGHGTSDRINGKLVQGIVMNDLEVIYEWELRQMFADLGNVAFIVDCCFSGGLLRGRQKQRWVPISHCFRREVSVPSRLPAKPRYRLVACRAGETAASTGKGGALTLAVEQAFQTKRESSTLLGLGEAVKKLLPTKECPQHPEVSYVDKAFAGRTLKSFSAKWNQKPR